MYRVPEITSCAERCRVHRGNPERESTVCSATDKGVAAGLGTRTRNKTGNCRPLDHPTSHALPSGAARLVLDEYARWRTQPKLIRFPASKYFPGRENPESNTGETTCFATHSSPPPSPRNRYVFGGPRQRGDREHQQLPAPPHGRAPRLHLRAGAESLLLRPVLWAGIRSGICSGGANHRTAWRGSLPCLLFDRRLLIIPTIFAEERHPVPTLSCPQSPRLRVSS